MPSYWTGCGRSVRSDVEVTREQSLHPFFILNDHDQVHSLHANLQSPVSTRNGDESGRTPAIRRAAAGYAFASLTSKDKAAFDHVRHNGHTLGVFQHFFRDSLIGHSHNFVQHWLRIALTHLAISRPSIVFGMVESMSDISSAVMVTFEHSGIDRTGKNLVALVPC